MGPSKKKSKNKAKQEARVTPKAKQRAKKAKQIEAGKRLKESRKAAAAATGASKGSGDKLAGIDSVDDLFKSDVFAEGASDDESDAASAPDVGGGADAAGSDSEESSAGAFQDVDGGSDGDGPEPADLSALDDEPSASHEKELLAIKKSDPAFYKFLVENDRQLLDFRDPEAPAESEDDAGEEDGEQEEAAATAKKRKAAEAEAAAKEAKKASAASTVTLERLKQLQGMARTSFTAFKAVLTSYHAAIRSIESGGIGAAAGDEEEAEQATKGTKSKRRRRKVRESLMQITDESVFSAIIEWTLANIVELFELYAGDLASSASALDPTKYSRWPRIKVVASIFWDETYFLLTHLTDNEMLGYLLRHVSTKQALAWLWPFRGVRKRFFAKCCGLWASSGAHDVRLTSFLFIRNSAAMCTVAQLESKPQKKDQTELEAQIRQVLRAFADAAGNGYSWRSVSTFRFMENCYLELLRIDDATSYRVGYVCVRQLAIVLRNACIATSQGGSAKAAADSEKQRKRKGLQNQQVQNLVGWPFVCSLYLWTKAVGTLPSLKLLAYPLSAIITGALKSRLSSIQYFPFAYHCFRCLNKLGASLEVFVPISSHVLKALSILLPAMDRAHRERKGGKAPGSGGNMPAKAPEIDILLKFSEGQAAEVMTLEAIGGSLLFILMDHLGMLARSPSFPEVSAPVLFHLRKHSKHCRSENLRRQLKQMIAHAEATAQDITARREALPGDAQATAWKRLFVFEPDSAMGKARKEALARKEREEKGRVEAETRAEGKAEAKAKRKAQDEGVEAGEGDERADRKKAKKREKQKARRKRQEAEAKAAAEAAANGGAKAGAERFAPKGAAKKDLVEEMAFSSGDESS
eukprot:TRINITY_DN72654_c0_g1_i1.p1 TRINITY_DN72654_c0_g1~~TRINITY_DN72654_c0_g1_i1.p1  ORF type:complete len:904 (+),score=285.79 TRINITY_DN72654_c0_g1_i1:120-2714(+)